MASTAATVADKPHATPPSEVSLAPPLCAARHLSAAGRRARRDDRARSRQPRADGRGVIASLLGAVWLLAFLGLRYPLQMLPLLMFEFALEDDLADRFGLPQWAAGQRPPTFAEDFFNIGSASS